MSTSVKQGIRWLEGPLCYQLTICVSGPKQGILLTAQETSLHSVVYEIGWYNDILENFRVVDGFALCPTHLAPSVPDICGYPASLITQSALVGLDRVSKS